MHERPVVPPLDDVLACVREDRRAGRLEGWSWSTVIDENVGEAVVDRELFERIHEAADVTARFPVGNAGLIHVYGYLFSTVRTPYGFKSDRWNDGALARSLDFPDGWFRLGDSDDETPLERVLEAALPLLVDPPADMLVRDWPISETTAQRAVVTSTEDGPGALVSGIDDGSGWKLLTIFPVSDTATFAGTLDDATRPRWNAAPPRVPDSRASAHPAALPEPRK